MKFHRRWATATLVVVALGVSSVAHAALVSRLGGQAVYDTDLNVTWMADVDLAASNHFGISGIPLNGNMNWDAAQSWIGAMNAANYLGYNDWRLPTTLQPDPTCSLQTNAYAPYGTQSSGNNCTGSEMGHLFYNELGGTAEQYLATNHNANFNLFQNIQPTTGYYWSGTEFAPATGNAWNFDFAYGDQGWSGKTSGVFAWAVRTGDVAAVPIPAAVWLFGSGLLGLIGVARRKATQVFI